MDGNRRYADELEPGWYAGRDRYTDSGPNPYDSGVPEQPSGAFRLPEQRETEYAPPSPYVAPDPATSTGSHSQDQLRLPVRGPEFPAVRPGGAPSPADASPSGGSGSGSGAPSFNAFASEPAAVPASPAPAPLEQPYKPPEQPFNEPTTVVPPVGRYQADPHPSDGVYRTRRPVSAVLITVVTVALMVPVIMLLVQATFDDNPLASGVVPAVLLTLGLPLAGLGLYALASGGPVGRDSWLRPPMAYLPVGLMLLLAASLAVT